jgi:hypothetical protein
MRITVPVAVLAVASGVVINAQDPKLGLNGIFDIGSSNSSAVTQVFQHPAVTSNANDLNWGLDLNLRTYILDPRFISLTFEPSIHRGTGSTDSQGNRGSDIGGIFYLDFLKTSYFPFRFHFIDHSLSYEQEHLNSANVARRSLGFDWTLRKPKLPPVFINYDTSRFDYEFTLTPAAVTRTSSLLAGTQLSYAGWSTTLTFSRQSSTEAFTSVGTSTELVRGTATRKIGFHSQLSTTALYEHLNFSNALGTGGLDLPFWDIRTDLRTRHSEKLSTTFSHQYYRTGGETAVPSAGAGAARFELGTTAFNELRGQVSYRLSSSLTVNGTTDAAFLSAPASTIETAVRTQSFSGGIQWQRRFKFLQTRAGQQLGIEYAASNMGHSRQIPFLTSNAGLSVGEPRRVLISADGTYSDRPDLFEIGGRFTQREATASIETQALTGLRLRASAGINDFEYLTLRGREHFRTRTYSATISRSIFSLTVSRNADISLRNLLQDSLAITPQQLFVTLPIDAVNNAPFSATTGVYTTGAFSVRPRKRFQFDARYLRQRILFTSTPSVLLRQYEAYGTYRLGKFLFTAGILYLGDSTEDEVHSLRRYYYFRISRPFRIL